MKMPMKMSSGTSAKMVMCMAETMSLSFMFKNLDV
jgi:hypothetical protein